MVTNVISNVIRDNILKQDKNIRVKLSDIKNNLFLFVNCKVVNPTFENQTKETLTSRIKSIVLSDSFIRKMGRSDIVKDIVNIVMMKSNKKVQKDLNKKNKTLKISKLNDATMAGTYDSEKCMLFLTEGDSALSTCISGFSVTGRKYFGAFPLKGKPLNVRGESLIKIKGNDEIKNIISILGLVFGKKYKDKKSLRYGKVVIMTDSDTDGTHIKGLIINLFDTFWPELLDMDFIYEFITPIVRVNKGSKEKYFYSISEYKRWKKNVNVSGWVVTYYKGLGTIQPKESKIFFKNIDKHLIKFDTKDVSKREDLIDMIFNKKRSDDRKKWLLTYKSDGDIVDKFKVTHIYEDFVNKDFIEFSMSDNIRSIPSVLDGMKPSQRKILFTMFKKKYTRQIKVSSLAGSVTETTSYHHGQVSLEGSIVSMAHDFVGSNNINLLLPKGQFGTRLKGGKDSSASRYIFTELNGVTRYIFNDTDDKLLKYLDDDGFDIEPYYYVPIIPMILINGSDGIGTGWRSSIPKYSPIDVIDYLINKINGRKRNITLIPKYRGFKGDIIWDDDNKRYSVIGNIVKVNSTTLRITELPLGMWNDKIYQHLDNLIEEKKINGYIKNCTDTDINIVVNVSRVNMKNIMKDPYKFFNLETYLSLNNMYAFDKEYKLCKFDTPNDIIEYYYGIRLEYYKRRKNYLINKIEDGMLLLSNKIKFIKYIINRKLKVNNQPKNDIINFLDKYGFNKINNNYDYLLSMPIYSLTMEKVKELDNKYKLMVDELNKIKNTTEGKMWLGDLKELKKYIINNKIF
jgi:DNA topoisomerase-2